MGGSSSSSPSNQTTNTTAIDSRTAASDQGIAINAYGNKGTISYTTNDVSADIVKQALQSVADVVNRQADTTSAINEISAASNRELLNSVVELGKTTSTGGQSDLNKTLLYAMLAVVGMVALIFIVRR